METYETITFIKNRRSIRKFLPDVLTNDQIQLLSDVALASPSAMNQQPWRFHFITNPAILREVNEAALTRFREEGNSGVIDRLVARGSDSLFYGAPLVVIISAERKLMAGYAMIDSGIAVQTLAIAAESIGLGSCIIGLTAAAFKGSARAPLGRLIHMPDDHEFAISIAIGHPAMSKDAHEIMPDRLVIIQ
ncbi:MAG: nitroreductase [Eubacteriales bacterium]|nr:nitroreductase [Eubacteriales bacterium]